MRARPALVSASIIATIGQTLLPIQSATAQVRAPVTVRATAEQLFAIAEKLVQAGRADRAKPILALLARDPNIDVRILAQFRQSLLLEAGGNYREAAVLLRRIVDQRPQASAARLKLAGLLQKIGDEGAALRELRALRSAHLPPNVARFVDRLSASLQARKPFGVQFELSLTPDTNINRATTSETLGTVIGDFTVDDKARSGVGVAMRALAQARRLMTEQLTLFVRAGGEANLYRTSDFNDIALELAAGPELILSGTRFRVESAVGQQWYGMKPYLRSWRLAGSVTRPIGGFSQIRVEAGSRWVDHRVNDLQDGRGLLLRASLERALSPQTIVAVSIASDRYKARDDAYSTRSWNAAVTAYRDLGRTTLSIGAETGRLRADDRLVLLPQARHDRLTRFHVGAVFRQFTVTGFAPITRVVFERNQSNIEIYDYRRTRTEFGISRAF